MWDPGQYLKYAEERARPFFDLLARVLRERADRIADLGCGPGNLTRTLIERWPGARVVGIDTSAEMFQQAEQWSIPGRLEFVRSDLTSWSPDKPVDLIVSNAALQWVEDHETVLGRLGSLLAPGGTLAVQLPYHFETPAHLAIEEAKADPRWSAMLEGVGLDQQSVRPLVWYVERLHERGFVVDAWQTTYIHVLTGENPVLEWFEGTALRPLLQQLTPQTQAVFLHELGSRLKAAYPARERITLLPFPRLFFVATLP
jgi:trans-aconitate 2-methyltransferase